MRNHENRKVNKQVSKKVVLIMVFIVLIILFAIFEILSSILLEEKGTSSAKIELKSFENIDISVAAADFKIIYGNDYNIDYKFHTREIIKDLIVENNTLILKTKFSRKFSVDTTKKYINITIPKNKHLNDIKINNVSGNISLENLTFNNGVISTVSSDINAKNINCKNLAVKSVSNSINVSNSIILNSGEFVTTSGNILLNVDFKNITAKTFKGIYFNNNLVGNNFSYTFDNNKSTSIANITAASLSGKIKINSELN